MAYFKNTKDRDLVYSEVKNGNEQAINILKTLSSMTQDELNTFLANITPTPLDIHEVIKELIKDEYEAIDGYNKAIMVVKSQNDDTSELKIQQFQNIINEELKHISILKGLLE